MSDDGYVDLGWLPRPPADFGAQVRSMSSASDDLGAKLRQLAMTALDEAQLARLAAVLKAGIAKRASLPPLDKLKVAILSNATTDFLEPAIAATGLRYGFAIETSVAPYGQIVQQAMDPKSQMNQRRPDLVLCLIDHRGLPLSPSPGDVKSTDDKLAASIEFLMQIRKGIEANCGAVCIFQTLARPPEPLFGSLDVRTTGTWRDIIAKFNGKLVEALSGSPHLLIDTAGLAETVGLARWHDPSVWHMAKAPFANEFVSLYADHVGRLIAAWRGKGRKCLVLDLDNTLWGGVIGDDGLEGILIGEGDATGEAHLEVQRTALMLRDRGIVLAVSSKNDDAVARRPFREHPDVLIKEHHFAAFQANWDDKAANIAAIGKALNLGIDSLAFLDDNPVERDIVRSTLPSVAVFELPDDPAFFPRMIAASGFFESVAFSDEDLHRASDYQSNAERLELQKSFSDIDQYLMSLEMVMTCRPFNIQGRARIGQLINKSNQFNLTTRRYSEAEVLAAETDPDVETFQIRLKDRFADNGMISIVICRRAETTWFVDTWLMSCRVLGRKVEHAVLQILKSRAQEVGVEHIVGEYLPSEKNGMVSDHYTNLGFERIEQRSDKSTVWRIAVESISAENLPIRIEYLAD
jgi:FkbH-like protein